MLASKIGQRIITLVFWLSALLIAAILISLIVYIAAKGLPSINWQFLVEEPRRSGREGGILSPIIGTIYITVMSLLFAVPVGVGAAVYMQEYARKDSKFAYLVNLTAETLAGIPSIVFGLFGFVFFVLFLNMGWSVLSGSLTIAIMILPTIARTSQEALLTVPREYRENSLALGASKWVTIRKVVLPSAVPGILTGVILSIGRAVGETAALILTAGTALGMPMSLEDPARTMAVHLYILAMEGLSLERAFATAFVIVILVMIINYLANLSMRKLTSLAK